MSGSGEIEKDLEESRTENISRYFPGGGTGARRRRR